MYDVTCTSLEELNELKVLKTNPKLFPTNNSDSVKNSKIVILTT